MAGEGAAHSLDPLFEGESIAPFGKLVGDAGFPRGNCYGDGGVDGSLDGG